MKIDVVARSAILPHAGGELLAGDGMEIGA